LYWQEALVAAGCSLVVFVVFSTEAAMRAGRPSGFPVPLRQLFASETAVGPTGRRVAVVGASVFAALGQAPVLAVGLYRRNDLGVASLLLLGGEVVAALIWVLVLARWMRASGA
jgi:hypothetical protein